MNPAAIITAIIEKRQPMSAASKKLFSDLVEYHPLSKGTTFIRNGKVDSSEYFLLEGICRSFVSNEEGELISIAFFQDQSVLTPHIIRTAEGVSNISFEALTDCLVGRVDAEAFLQLMIDNLEIRTFANTILKEELIAKVSKEINLASKSAKNRLLAFRQTYHNLENLVPNEMIATYLGITRISLSRLRKEISLEK